MPEPRSTQDDHQPVTSYPPLSTPSPLPLITRRIRTVRRRIPPQKLFLIHFPDVPKNIIRAPSTTFGFQKNSLRDQITQIPQRRIGRAFHDFRPF